MTRTIEFKDIIMHNEDVRDAVITIQGGGVFGLSLLGQLQEIIEERKFTPMALAGTSAGAILATLLWARLSPSRIVEKLVLYAEEKALIDLLGPFETGSESFQFKDFISFQVRLAKLFKGVGVPKKNFLRRICDYPKMLIKINQFRKLKHELEPHFEERGFFRGDHLESFIEECLKEAPDAQAFSLTLRGEKLKFKHFREMAKQNGRESFRPPLFIPVTNLSTRRLELINSLDDEFLNVPISKAVRASAGFPVFFRPTELETTNEHGCYVDGGVVSNFPAWVFAKLFRTKIQQNEHFRWFASKAWVHIGLRVGGDNSVVSDLSDPAKFIGALASMVTGNARNELESHLVDIVPRSIVVHQAVTEIDGPTGFLDLSDLDGKKVLAMVSQGKVFAAQKLAKCPTSIVRLSNADTVVAELKNLVDRCNAILGEAFATDARLRANVFVAIKDKLHLKFCQPTAKDDPDSAFVFDFSSGLTGHCYTSRSPIIGNLAKIRELSRTNSLDKEQLLGMTSEQQELVLKDRTWLASVPIFDPYDFSLERKKISISAASAAPYSFRFSSPLDGGVIGTLSLDGAIDYAALKMDEDPLKHFTNPRVQAIIDTMQASAMRIGVLLAETFEDLIDRR